MSKWLNAENAWTEKRLDAVVRKADAAVLYANGKGDITDDVKDFMLEAIADRQDAIRSYWQFDPGWED